MFTYGKSKAEERFDMYQNRTARIHSENDDAQQQEKEHRAELRALRKAREAAEKQS